MLLRGMSKRIQNWNKFFERIAQVCQDSRMSIAMNAVDTYFASFSEQLSAGMFQKENIALFVESDFGKFVQGIERVPTLKQIVLERLAELSCNNWQSFRDVPTFETTFIPSLIQMEDSITARFVNFYSLFYKCTFVSDQIEILLRRSIEHRIPFIAKSTDDELLQDLLLFRHDPLL